VAGAETGWAVWLVLTPFCRAVLTLGCAHTQPACASPCACAGCAHTPPTPHGVTLLGYVVGADAGVCGAQVFTDVMTDCYDYIDEASGRHSKIIADDVYDIMMANKVSPPLPPTPRSLRHSPPPPRPPPRHGVLGIGLL
jgi:hypothetical protein